MTIKERKLIALNEVLYAYEVYKGKEKSKLEKLLDTMKLSGEITTNIHDIITNAVHEYKKHLLKILAFSVRVRVVFDNNNDKKSLDINNNSTFNNFDFPL